ncbi:hypothetical protein D3C76_1610080 [compost metagenome]
MPSVITGQNDFMTRCAFAIRGRAFRLEYPERATISVFDGYANIQALRKPGHDRPFHGFW